MEKGTTKLDGLVISGYGQYGETDPTPSETDRPARTNAGERGKMNRLEVRGGGGVAGACEEVVEVLGAEYRNGSRVMWGTVRGEGRNSQS